MTAAATSAMVVRDVRRDAVGAESGTGETLSPGPDVTPAARVGQVRAGEVGAPSLAHPLCTAHEGLVNCASLRSLIGSRARRSLTATIGLLLLFGASVPVARAASNR